MTDHRIVWFVDENDRERRTYRRELVSMLPPEITVEAIPPFPTKEEYLPLLDTPSTACLIIDQKLKNTGIASYTGIELAQFLRGVNRKIPIYILTNFAQESQEFIGGEWSVEQIIGKDELRDDEQACIVIARMLRHMDTYRDLLSKRAERFGQLLRKSLVDELDDTEQKELAELQFERTSATLAVELAQLNELEQIVQKHKELMNSFKQAADSEAKNAE